MPTDFPGTVDSPTVQLLASHLAYGPATGTPYKLSVSSRDFSGAYALGSPAAPPRVAFGGTISEGFGGRCIFERVLVEPQKADLGAVLTQRTINVTLWNTFRQVEEFWTGVVITGPGSASVITPSFPKGLVPFGIYVQDVVYPTVGDPVISQSIDFVFAGVDGTTLLVTGNRLAVFGAAEPNWEPNGIIEKPQLWMTDVLKAHSDSEQRVQLRTLPRSSIKMRVTPDRATKALLEALLWGWQSQVYGVPFWPDNQPLLSPAITGDVVVHFDTSDREFAAGGLLLVWRSAFELEVITIVSLVSGGVQVVASGLANNYAADGRTRCIPVRRGRMADVQDVTRTTCLVSEIEFTFECEVV